jgi:hypothetical protein
MFTRDSDVDRYRREMRKRRSRIEAEKEALIKEAKVSYKEATKPYRPGRPRGIRVGKQDPDAF